MYATGEILLHSAKSCLHSCCFIETRRAWAADMHCALFLTVHSQVLFFTYPQYTQFLFHLGWMIIFSTLMDCSGPPSRSMSCSPRTTLYVWNLDNISKYNGNDFFREVKSTVLKRLCYQPPHHHKKKAGKEDSSEICHGQLYGRASSPFNHTDSVGLVAGLTTPKHVHRGVR